MSKRNEDSVEQFFRKAAAQQDSTFMQRDWEKMEKMLDAEAAKLTVAKFQRIKRRIFAGAVVTGIVALVYFLVIDQQHPESRLLADASMQKQAVAGAEAPTTEPKMEDPSTATLFSEGKTRTKPLNKVGENPVIARVQKNSLSQRSNESLTKSRSYTETNTLPIERLENSRSLIEGQSGYETPEDSFIVDSFAENGNTEGLKVATGGVDAAEVNNDTEQATKASDAARDEGADAEKGDDQNQKDDQNEKKNNSFSRWNVAVAFAPDFSTTVLTRYSSPGDAFGLTIGFNPLRRLSINTGVFKTAKQYVGNGSEYQPPPNYWNRRTNGIVPDQVRGQCTVIEFPLNIQYQINSSTRNRIFASVGVSSYYMLDEAYHYEFETPNPGAAEKWSSDEPSSYAFSIGHLSAAYERQVSRNIYVGIEPFLKIPFAGIGWTNIQLFTTGAYFNLRYRFNGRQSFESVSRK